MTEQLADWTSHHIEGYAREAYAINHSYDEAYFNAPLMQQVKGNLWQGGCIDGVELPDDFVFVLSLYKWEQYAISPNTTRVEVEMYDSADGVLPVEQLLTLAELVNVWLPKGKVLVHCQAGLNRSGLLAALTLMTGPDKMKAQEAIDLLRAERSPLVLCNKAFESWLLSQEPGQPKG